MISVFVGHKTEEEVRNHPNRCSQTRQHATCLAAFTLVKSSSHGRGRDAKQLQLVTLRWVERSYSSATPHNMTGSSCGPPHPGTRENKPWKLSQQRR